MRIGIDARELCGQPTGVGRYLQRLLAEWSASTAASRHVFFLYAHDTLPGATSAWARTQVIPGHGGTAWEQCVLPIAAWRDRIDVFFAPAYTAPLALRMPFVVTIHDLSFVAHPEWFRPREGMRRRWLTRRSACRASAVLTVSEFSRGEIISRFGILPTKVHTVRHGVGTLVDARVDGRRREPIVLFVGSLFNRRRLPDLIRAFGHLAAQSPDVRLEIVGDDRTYPHQDLPGIVLAEGLEGRVSIRSYVSDEELADLYGRARVFAFLSEYEGFGLTPLEALASGVPVVALDTVVAHETCGDAALYVPRADVTRTVSALRSAMSDEVLRSRLLNRARDVLARYSWAETARETLGAIERTIEVRRD